jgi:DNA-binding transcriptional MerR regulator/methylmalonyl-CoA mutase cobalamin-binding subunit
MKKTMGTIPIAVVEQETGLSKDVLRKWEIRYNYPIPGRNEFGDRVYSQDQVVRLRAIKRLLDQGYRPAKLLGLNAEELAGLINSTPSSARSLADASAVSDMLEMLKGRHPQKLRAALKRQLQNQGLKLFVQDTIAPLSSAVGAAWSRGEIQIYEEHLFSDIATVMLRQTLDAIDAPDGKPRLLLTTLPGEPHTLGLLMAACLFTLRGAHCLYLGAETPAGDIAQAARTHSVDAIALSFSSAFPSRWIAPALSGLRQLAPASIDIVAGGAGLLRQKPMQGIHFITDFAGIEEYVAQRQAAYDQPQGSEHAFAAPAAP